MTTLDCLQFGVFATLGAQNVRQASDEKGRWWRVAHIGLAIFLFTAAARCLMPRP